MPKRFSAAILGSLVAGAAAAQGVPPAALDPFGEPPAPVDTVAPADAIAQARAAAARGDAADALARYLRVLSTRPDDVAALAGAGRAALDVGDLDAASGFFGHAEGLAPNDGTVKAGIGATLARQGDARGALRYFRAAVALGVPDATIAADRGLAYDLRGDGRRAQAEYALALKARPADAAILRRLALSQAIGGDQATALATLDPLLRRQDVPAWRTRMFARAVAGDVAGANADAALILTAPQVATLVPYLARLPALRASDKAAAVFLGRFPGAARVVATVPPGATALALASPLLPSTAPSGETGGAAPADAAAVPDSAGLRALRQRVASARGGAGAAGDVRSRKAEPSSIAAAARTRYWVQVAGGTNGRGLSRTWAALKARWPRQLGGRSAWTMRYRATSRLLIGPFDGAGEARAWIKAQRRAGLRAFAVTSAPGAEVAPLG